MPIVVETVYRVLESPTSFTYQVVDADGKITEVLTAKQASRVVGGRWLWEDAVIVSKDEWDALLAEFTEGTKHYLKCEDCGEVFDAIETAAQHGPDDCPDFNIDTTYTIVTEEEAF